MSDHAWKEYIERFNSADPRSSERVRVAAEDLRRASKGLLIALGLPPEDAEITADVFVQSDLRGEESHGSRLLLNVLARIEAGGDNPKSEIAVIKDRGAMALWDAQRGIGQVVATKAMRRAIEKARDYGIGVVGVRNANSYTSAKYYPLLAAEADMIGITYANSGVQLVVAEGGRTPIVGTNPVSIAAPAKSEPTFVLDMAVSVAMEKMFQAHERNETVPTGWGIDSEGNDTTNPADVLGSRCLLPIAGPKGFGLGLAHEVLTCILMGGQLFGGGATGFIPYAAPMNVSQHFQAINIDWFVSLEEFKERMDEALRIVRASKPRPGVERVYYPGEHSYAEEVVRLREGIPLPRRAVDALNSWCAKTNVDPLRILG